MPTQPMGGVEYGGGRLASAPGEASVADAMVRRPKLLSATATRSDVRDLFSDDHVHAALVVDGERLLTVIEPHEVEAGEEETANTLGTLQGRTISSDADLWETWVRMTETGRRRLVVVDRGRCVGLLCLKSSGRGFCCDAGIQARNAHPSHLELIWDE
ncbi:CBS domain-containing protein [Nocardioides albus]|uniref:Putative transcriptional regulator n=1 Tax=Nocardioides albus TaxID=1841 RepID=A0A7W5F8B2_9ACTN|nr:CBS domain-containing protein [Nocardioides albus]MBB3088958.1 putative transcriptional regulator [Nocardioides albus]